MNKPFTIVLFAVVLCLPVLFTACDTPKTMAWHHYYYAKKKLESGDPYAAKKYLEHCNTEVDSLLSLKADTLMKVITQAIEEKEKGHKE